MSTIYVIPCHHERDGMPHDNRVDDYHPLSRCEVKTLLIEAHRLYFLGDFRGFSGIQCRFGQAIPGATCPHRVDGWTATRSARLDELFVYTVNFEVCEPLVDLFVWIMTDEPHLRDSTVDQPAKETPEERQ